MICPVLGIVIFDQKRRPLDHVVMWLARFQTSRPLKMDVFHTRFVDSFQILFSQVSADTKDMLVHQTDEGHSLAVGHLRRRKSTGFTAHDSSVVPCCQAADSFSQKIGNFAETRPALLIGQRFRQRSDRLRYLVAAQALASLPQESPYL